MDRVKLIALIIAGLVLLLAVFDPFRQEPKCGQDGYFPKLSDVCRAGHWQANGDAYCTADELKDIACAKATYDRINREESEEMRRKMTERHY